VFYIAKSKGRRQIFNKILFKLSCDIFTGLCWRAIICQDLNGNNNSYLDLNGQFNKED
jgi:hypothetical protein